MRRFASPLAFTVVLILAYGPRASADLVVGWNFNGVTGFGSSPYNAAPANTNSNLSGAVGLSRGSGVSDSGSAFAYSDAWGGNGFSESTLTAAISANDFVSLSITVGPAVSLSLTNIAPYNVRRTSVGPTSGQWQYQLESGGWNNIGSAITWGGIDAAGNLKTQINLASISELQDLSSGTTVSFRVANWGGTSGGNWYFNDFSSGNTSPNGLDLVINGTFTTVAVPEPSAFLFGGLICTVLVANQLRKRLRAKKNLA